MALQPGPAKRMTIYIDDGDQYRGQPIYEALMDLFMARQMAGVTLFRGLSGYGSDRTVHTAKLLTLTENLPIKLEIVDRPEKIDEILPDVQRIVTKGLVDVAETTLVHVPGSAA